ncbi:hypothetical protein GCM10010170_075580 [Dactylosporangium salmoneum]|uniref:Uncharacterized protein n=1 Tax=Dactylosporangium salmoneum TaxID=53361 RepID=A0ABN3HAH3_9ACTN
MTRVLMIVSAADSLTLADGTTHPTGFWAEEVAASHRVLRNAGVDIQPVGEYEGFGHAFDQDGHVRVEDDLRRAASAGVAQPQGLAADRGEHGAHSWLCGGRTGGEDEQLTVLGGTFGARDGRVHEQRVGPPLGEPADKFGGRLRSRRRRRPLARP